MEAILSKESITAIADNLPTKKVVADTFMLWHGTNNTNPHDTISQVREFEQACGAILYPLGTPPPLDKLKLRLSLELEELYEKAQAMGLEGTFQRHMEDVLRERTNYVGRDIYDGGPYQQTIEDTNVYDPVALMDACCDQRYVQDGTMLTCGLDAAFPEAFANVHASNMSKFPGTMDEAAKTSVMYKERGVETVWAACGGKWPVRQASNGKILKSYCYTPAALAPILLKYTQP